MTSSAQGTLIVTMTLDPARSPDVARHFTDDVVPWAAHQDGFVSGQWLRSPDGSHGIGIVTFDSVDHATAAAAGPRSQPRDDGRAWNTGTVDVFHVVASANSKQS